MVIVVMFGALIALRKRVMTTTTETAAPCPSAAASAASWPTTRSCR
jgi:hypothetical protein